MCDWQQFFNWFILVAIRTIQIQDFLSETLPRDAMPSLCVNALGLYWPRPVSARLSVVSLNSVFSLAKYGEFWCILDGIFYSSATCFTRKTGVQPLYAYKSRDGE